MGLVNSDPGALFEWRERLLNTYLDCSGAGPCEEVSRLQQVGDLYADAPGKIMNHFDIAPDLQRFQAMMTVGTTEGVLPSLLGDRGGYMVSRSSSGACSATVCFPGLGGEISESGSTVVLAFLAALLLALIQGIHDLELRGVLAIQSDDDPLFPPVSSFQ